MPSEESSAAAAAEAKSEKVKRQKSDKPKDDRRWWLRVLTPKPTPERPRDLAADVVEQASTERAVVAGLAVYIPLAGALAVTINLALQVKGYQALALAIIENLSLGSLALVVLTNLLTYLLPAVAVGLVRVRTDKGFSPSLRYWAMVIQLFILAVALYVLPWPVATIAIIASWTYWRFGIFVPNASPPKDITTWLNEAPPLDSVQRDLWLEGRRRLRAEGREPTVHEGVVEETVDAEPRSLTDVGNLVNERGGNMQKSVRKTAPHAVYMTLVTALSLYGVAALFGPVQLAPLEKVTLQGHAAQVGYVFSTQPGDGIFVPRTMDSLVRLDEVKITDRQLCGTSRGWGPLIGLSAKTTGADCSIGKP